MPTGDAKSVDVRCITGDSQADDKTGAGVLKCDSSTKKIYYWASQNPNSTDQSVYAAKEGSVVVIVPKVTATEFFSIGGGLASVMLAVGIC